VESGILGFGIRNKALGIRIPTGVWNPESNDWNPESGIVGIHGVESRIRQDCPLFLYMGRKVAVPHSISTVASRQTKFWDEFSTAFTKICSKAW